MAADLDAALQPGETIVFRTRGRAYGGKAIALVALLVSVPLYSAGRFAIVPAPGLNIQDVYLTVGTVTAAVGIVTALILLHLVRRQRRAPDDVVITDRRLLFTRSEWSHKIEAVALDRIDRVTWSRSHQGAPSLEVTVAGRVLDLPTLRQADALAKALTDATGASPLPSLGRMAVAEFLLPGAAVMWAVSYLTIWFGLATSGFLPDDNPASFAFRILDVVVTLVALGIAWLLARPVGGLLTATLMRPFATPEQMQAGLCAGQPDVLWLRIALRWAGYLYGRPLPYLAS